MNDEFDVFRTDEKPETEEGEEEESHETEEIIVSYACEDCDYRWEVTFEDEEDEANNDTQYCPMCGSASCTQI